MFIRFAKLTPRFEDDDDIVVSTKEIAESYQERQTKDGELDTALAAMVCDLRMCIWEANYIDWLATVIHRAKYSKFFSEPSKATKLQAQYLAQVASGRLDLQTTMLGLEPEKDSQAGLFRRACAHLNQSESAVLEAIRQCVNKKVRRMRTRYSSWRKPSGGANSTGGSSGTWEISRGVYPHSSSRFRRTSEVHSGNLLELILWGVFGA